MRTSSGSGTERGRSARAPSDQMRRIGDRGGEGARSAAAAALPRAVICPVSVAKEAMDETADSGVAKESRELSSARVWESIPEQQFPSGEVTEEAAPLTAPVEADW